MTFLKGSEVYHSAFGIGMVEEVPSESSPYVTAKFGPTVRTVKPEFLREVTENLRPSTPLTRITEWGNRGAKEIEMLRMLRAAGKNGVTNMDFVNNSDIGHRFSVTVQSLRDKGYVLDTVKVNARTFKTVLMREP